ncbi:(2Fe-2S)-binding protein [Modestobacter sp. VKM Ac-2977]|uniref:(2Fe-2S)-binding protein n=1 Tax=Modestobacter sp. VKM Ac-2977 TaxID=3004131 RepID=UPI0022AACE07|nr:(2Fe-2S)-binding protein [Modestobacter sp. VKM Ac-2977]MCZ2818835.1 (2Fe-2S)-binding protein [Modestobacter sp. VKM Ac-2977]
MSDDGAQALVVSRLPGAAALGLLAPPSAAVVPGPLLADPGWTAQLLTTRAVRQRTDDRRVLATVWWYSLSSVLLTPVLAGLVTGVGLSARLVDTTVHALAGGVPVAATTRGGSGPDLAGDLRTTIDAVVAAVAEAGGTRERPLWAIATDSLANRLLALGRAVGDVATVTALAGPLAAAIGAPLPVPRYVDVGRPDGGATRFTRRASCCLLYRVPHEVLCTSCPRRDPGERQVLLEDLAERM